MMPKKKYAPRPGSKIAFVAAHIGLTNAEVHEKAKAAGLDISIPVIDASRWTLKNKHKVSSSTAIVPYKAAVPSAPKRKYKPRAALAKSKDKKDDTVRAHKEAQIRKLFFEVGFDAFKTIYMEFQEMHDRWS